VLSVACGGGSSSSMGSGKAMAVPVIVRLRHGREP
jgi:hypothetical protein